MNSAGEARTISRAYGKVVVSAAREIEHLKKKCTKRCACLDAMETDSLATVRRRPKAGVDEKPHVRCGRVGELK